MKNDNEKCHKIELFIKDKKRNDYKLSVL